MKFLFLFVAFWCAVAQAQFTPTPPPVAARSWLLLDAMSEQLLASDNPDERVEPASLTKLMTAYIAFTALKQKALTLDQAVSVSEHAWRATGSRMFIEPKKPVTVGELLQGVIVQSGNDASIALAETIAGSEESFALMMNREAQRLGMKNTHFMNATGLPDPGHYSTARDIAMLAMALINDFPEYYRYYSQKTFTYNKIAQPNRNRLLWMDPYVDGVKTGHTEAAGYCLVASAKRGPRRLISVVMGASSDATRAQESQKLLNFGFQFYDAVRLYEQNQAVAQLRVWKGAQNIVKAGFLEDFVLSLPKGQSENIKVKMESKQPLMAPVQVGEVVGTAKLFLHDKPIGEYPVVALETIPVAGLVGRAWDSMKLWFE